MAPHLEVWMKEKSCMEFALKILFMCLMAVTNYNNSEPQSEPSPRMCFCVWVSAGDQIESRRWHWNCELAQETPPWGTYVPLPNPPEKTFLTTKHGLDGIMRCEINNYEEFWSLHLCTELNVGTAGIQYDLLCDSTLPADAQGEGHTSSQSSRAQHFSRPWHIHYRLPTNRMCVAYTL